jgi:cytochrome c-type biogenesis protein CcmE
MKRPLTIILLVVVGSLSLFLLGRLLSNSEVLYLEPNEALEQKVELGDSQFLLGGLIRPGSITTDGDVLRFVVTDFTNAEILVRTTETPPELFSDKTGVFLEGTFEGDEFHATTLLLRHEETYEAPAEAP